MGGAGHVGYQQGRRKSNFRKEKNKKKLCMRPHFSLLYALQLDEILMQGREHTENLGWSGLVSLHLYLSFCELWNNAFLYPSWSLCIWLSWQPRLHEDETFRDMIIRIIKINETFILISSSLYQRSQSLFFFFLFFSPLETSKQPAKFPFSLKINSNIKHSFLFWSQVDACYCLAKETNC